jgi:hypothetical protein
MSSPTAPKVVQVVMQGPSQFQDNYKLQYHPGRRVNYKSKTKASKDYMGNNGTIPRVNKSIDTMKQNTPKIGTTLTGSWVPIPTFLSRFQKRRDITLAKYKRKKANTRIFKQRNPIAKDVQTNKVNHLVSSNYYQPLADTVYIEPINMDKDQIEAAAAAKLRFEAIKKMEPISNLQQ